MSRADTLNLACSPVARIAFRGSRQIPLLAARSI